MKTNLPSIVLIVAICALALKLVSGPFYRRYDAAECLRAYSRAHTHADSGRIDLRPYTGKGRCVEVRGQHTVSSIDLPGIRQPK